MDNAPANSGELYVNYLPVPARDRRFLRVAVPAGLWLLCIGGFFWARTQHAPGKGVWEDANPVKTNGTLILAPYPILVVDGAGGRTDAVLLVEMGKHGPRRMDALSGKRVTISGWPLHRDGRRMIELEPGDDAIATDGTANAVAADSALAMPRAFTPVTLRGEIVDSKCYYGAMKPGEGKTHKECATLCIRGGIPPMFVTRGGDGLPVYVLMTDAAGGPLEAGVHPFIGDFVELSGEWAEWCGMRVVRVRAENIRRL